MQPLVVFSVLIVATAVNSCYAISEMEENIHAKMMECGKEMNVDIVELEKAERTGELSDEHRKEIGCVKACVMEGMELLEDGKINLDKMKEVHDELQAQAPKFALEFEVLEECAKGVEDETDKCEIGRKFDECFLNALKEHHHE